MIPVRYIAVIMVFLLAISAAASYADLSFTPGMAYVGDVKPRFQAINQPAANTLLFDGSGTGNTTTYTTTQQAIVQNTLTPTTSISTPSSYSTTLTTTAVSNTPTTVNAITTTASPAANVTTSFYETGLPQNAIWSIDYGGVTSNAMASNYINFTGEFANVIYSVIIQNVTYGNYTFVPDLTSNNVIAGLAYNIAFTEISSMPASTAPTSSTYTTTSTVTIPALNGNIQALQVNGTVAMNTSFLEGVLSNSSIFVSNSSILGRYENGTTANIIAPVALNYSKMSNLTSLDQDQIDVLRARFAQMQSAGIGSYMSVPGNHPALHSFNESIDVPYDNIMQAHRFVKAGSVLNYVAYNTHGIITYYTVNVTKAQPKLAIGVNGARVITPNSVSMIHVPVMKGQRTYTVSLSLDSVLAQNNSANYTYQISFSNGTVISKSINASAVNYSHAFALSTNQTATITFETGGDSNYTAVDPTVIVIPVVIESYIPITLSNSQSVATPAPFQQMLSVNSLEYSAYEANNLDNIEFFYANGTIMPSWMEGSYSNALLNNPANSIYLYTSTNTIYWLNISSGISANNGITVYMGFALTSANVFNNVNVGESPQISSTYAQYDDGNDVFLYYNVNPVSTTGWNVVGHAGQTSSAPAGSHFATTNALYANSANGDYLYKSVPSLTSNIIISYDVYTTGLGNIFFLVNSAGKGQMTRLDGRGGSDYSGLATTASWTSWSAPSAGLSESKNIWYKYDIVVSGTSAHAYIGSILNNLAAYGTVTSSSAFTIADDGNYIGLIGDALGSSYVTYWNGMIIRAYPPNGAMPTATFGSVVSTNAPVLIFQSNPVNYGNTDVITASATTSGDTVEMEKNGNVIAGPGANTVSYTVCGATPSLASCWMPGNYIITVKDITNGASGNVVLTINKGMPALTLSALGAILDTGSGVTIGYGISTVGNQIAANLTVDGATVSSTSSSNTYTFTPSIGFHTFETTTPGNGNYSSSNIASQSCVVPTPSQFPGNVLYYAPLCVINNQSTATVAPFQAMINITESAYAGNLVYSGNFANFEIFNATGVVQPAWIESNQSGKLVTWVKMANGIAANSISPLYLGIAGNTFNMLSGTGTSGIGEIPTASSTYGEYDDGASVFDNYFAGNSLSGWATAGTAGQTASAPSGSPFGADAFYTNGANGDYLDTTANGQSGNMIIEYYTDTASLDDLYFLVDSTGAGQMGRVGNGGGWYGVTSTSSWTSWTAPPDTGQWSNKWILVSIAVASGSATMYVSPSPGIYGSEMGQNASNTYTVANNGNYIGLIGDGGGGNQYWDGMIIRAYPPNGIMPSVSFGSLSGVSVATCQISLSTDTLSFGTLNPSLSTSANSAVTDTNAGSASAYMYVYGGNWVSGSNSFGVSNTVWSAASQTSYTGTPLSATSSNTAMLVPASGSNTIYFGTAVPASQPSGAYAQTITIENSC